MNKCYFVISHGASLMNPLLVNVKTAEWLLSQGVKVVNLDDYLKIKESLMKLEDAINQLIEDEFIEQLSSSELSCYEPAIFELINYFIKEKKENKYLEREQLELKL